MINTIATAGTATDFEAWLAALSGSYPGTDAAVLARAWQRATVNTGVRGQSLDKALAVAGTLDSLGMDAEVVAVPLLCVALESGAFSQDDLATWHGERIAMLVSDVYKLKEMGDLGGRGGRGGRIPPDRQLDGLRKLLLSVVRDVRVILVLLSERLYEMRRLDARDVIERQRLARETLDIFAPLANRLGVGQLKWELEDLALRHLQPERYRTLARELAERRADRERYVEQLVTRVRTELTAHGISGEVYGRAKHLYSIWKKMQRKQLRLDQLYDVLAIRIVVDGVPECYAALGLVHAAWTPIAQEFDDYIASPKRNGYQSLHTAVAGPAGRVVEIQIRTVAMHEAAELGVAAHWRYKEGVGEKVSGLDARVAWMRQLLESGDGTDADLLDRFRSEAIEDRVYALTPDGDVMDLPSGATALDFAYKLHSDLGHRCRGAKIGGRIVPLTQALKSGDRVEILTAGQGGPSRDWLNPNLGYLKSARARAKVRHWFRNEDRENNIVAGKTSVDRELSRLGFRNVDLKQAVNKLDTGSVQQLYAAIGFGDITLAQLLGALQSQAPLQDRHPVPAARVGRESLPTSGGDVQVSGVGRLLTVMARCCHPVPPEPILGYITQGRGVTIHRADCKNALNLSTRHPQRAIEVSWGGPTSRTYPVDICFKAVDRPGLLRDVTAVLAKEGVNVLALNTTTDGEDATVRTDITVEVEQISDLSRVLDKLTQISNVMSARRR